MLKLINPNYCATVVKVEKLVQLENCNNVQAAIIMGNQIIVSKEVKIGDIGLFFPLEVQLSKKYLSENNLYRKKELNSDPEAKSGYFEENGRIRCVKFRGHKSEGLFMPLNSLDFLNLKKSLSIGDEFNEIDGVEIAKKYVIKIKQSGSSSIKNKSPKESKIIEGQFNFHIDTSQLYRNLDKINPNDLIQITYKIHGCVSEDTIINTDQGDFTIKSIVDNKLKVNIKAFDTETNQVVYVPIDEYYLLKNDGEWYEIELEDGTLLKITGNNPVWLPELNCYRKAELLNVSDVLLVYE